MLATDIKQRAISNKDERFHYRIRGDLRENWQ
jgi:hypothetical protein